ncbi:hypothetical protein BgiBS90_027147, partial [Biomphalaria glabrata]
YTENGYGRRFIICGAYGSCSTDFAYFLAIDQVYDYCWSEWKMSAGSYPVFITSKSDGMVKISSNDNALADVMAIFVKF